MQVFQTFGGGGQFLFSVLATNFVTHPNAAPLMREDSVSILHFIIFIIRMIFFFNNLFLMAVIWSVGSILQDCHILALRNVIH